MKIRDLRDQYRRLNEINIFRKKKSDIFTIGKTREEQYIIWNNQWKKIPIDEKIEDIIEDKEIYIVTKKDQEFKIYSWEKEKAIFLVPGTELILLAENQYLYRKSRWDNHPIFHKNGKEMEIKKNISSSLYQHFVISNEMLYYLDFNEDPLTHQLRYLELGDIFEKTTSTLYGVPIKDIPDESKWIRMNRTNQKRFSLLKKEPFSQKAFLIEYHFFAHQIALYELDGMEKMIKAAVFFNDQTTVNHFTIELNPIQIKYNQEVIYPPNIQKGDRRIKYQYFDEVVLEYCQSGSIFSEIIDYTRGRRIYKGQIFHSGKEWLLY